MISYQYKPKRQNSKLAPAGKVESEELRVRDLVDRKIGEEGVRGGSYRDKRPAEVETP